MTEFCFYKEHITHLMNYDSFHIWKDYFKGPVFYSHDTSQSCGVLIDYFGNLNLLINKQIGYQNGCILILDVNIDKITYVLVGIYNGNTEVEQVLVLSELRETMKNTFLGRMSYIFRRLSQFIF